MGIELVELRVIEAIAAVDALAAECAALPDPDPWHAGELQVIRLRLERLRRQVVSGAARQGRAVAA